MMAPRPPPKKNAMPLYAGVVRVCYERAVWIGAGDFGAVARTTAYAPGTIVVFVARSRGSVRLARAVVSARFLLRLCVAYVLLWVSLWCCSAT